MTPLFGPGWGNYAIKGIVETPPANPVSLWPSTPGWWLLLTALVLWLAYLVLKRWRRWQRNRYRRDALAALRSLRTRWEAGDNAALAQLAPLLRSTALAACDDRSAIASLGGAAWTAALQSLAPGLPPLPTAELHKLAYAPPDDVPSTLPKALDEQIFMPLTRWITEHESPHA